MKLYEMQEQKLDTLYDRLNVFIKTRLDSYNHLMDKYKSNYILNNPKILLESSKNKLDTLKVKLDLLNPENILDKGYSIIYKDNKIVKDVANINVDDEINIVVKNGNINANVKGVNKK